MAYEFNLYMYSEYQKVSSLRYSQNQPNIMYDSVVHTQC